MSEVPGILADGRARIAALVGLSGIGQAAATGLAAFATRDLFAALHEAGAGAASAAAAALAILIGAGIVVALLRVIERTIAERLGQRYAIALRRVLYRQLARMPASAVAGRRAGALALRFVGDLSAARNWAGLGLTRAVSSAFVIPGAALALWLLHPALARLALIPLGVSLLVMAALSIGMGRLHRRLRSKRAGVAIAMLERVPMAPELDLMARTSREMRRLDEDGATLAGRSTTRMGLRMALRATPEIGAALAGAAILWGALRLGAPAAEAAGMLAVIGILSVPLRELADVWDRRCAWAVARAKLGVVLAQPRAPRRRMARGGPPPVRCEGVRFRGLAIDLAVEPGETVLIEGPLGSGKSSLLGLIAGLEVPDEGEVDFGERDRRPLTVHVSPRSPVLQGSLRRALTLGVARRPDDARIAEVAERFGLGPLMVRLDGLDGQVGEGARTLSDGEALRLHLARAALSAPDLLVIDLGGVGVDADLARALDLLIREGNATTFIAPGDSRLAPLADRRLVIEDGTIEDVAADADHPRDDARRPKEPLDV